MPETLTAADFEQRVHEMSERLEALRSQRGTTGSPSPLPYTGLNLEEELPGLIPILSALIHQDPEEPVARNARIEVGGRRLALAALSTLVSGGEGLSDFPARYKKYLGTEPEYALFDQFLPAAMREAGLAVPARADSKRLLEVLFVAGGLPAALVEAAAEFFVHYWRWFHPHPQPLSVLRNAGNEWDGLDAETRKRLEALSKRLLPNVSVLAPLVEGLSTVMDFLRTQAKWRVGDLFAQAAEIREGSGVDPQALLRNNEQALAVLAEGLGLAWHPEQFRHVVTALNRGGEVRMPNGSLTMAEKAAAIPYWGLYKIEHKTYLVLPNEGLDLAMVRQMAEGAITVVGNRVVWRGADEADVLADRWPQITRPRHLYEERQSLGWFYFNVAPAARTLQIGDQVLQPRPGVHWRTALIATVDDEGKASLNAHVAGLRVCLPEFAGQTLQLECPQADTAGRLIFELDERGVGGLPDRLLPLSEPAPGFFELYLQDQATGAVIERDGQPLSHRVPLPEVMLFNLATGEPVPPSSRPYVFGQPKYVLFANRPVNTGAMQMIGIGIDKLGKLGEYDAHRITWKAADEALAITLDAQFTWTFQHRLETVWQAGDLPAPQAPMIFAPETPVGYTVSSADDLYVDEISLVESPLVTIARDGEVLAAHTWTELNWLMNFPEENRRFSGVMLRRALHVNQDFDLAGRYTLGLKYGNERLGERQLLILPKLDVKVFPAGAQVEETRYKVSLKAEHPCFEGYTDLQTLDLGSPVVDSEAMENSPFQPKALEAVAHLMVPLFDLHLSVVPDVVGFRLLDEDEGTWIRKTNLGYDELGHITLVLFGAHAKVGSLKVGDDEALTEEFYEGFATFSLASLKETLKTHETELSVEVDGKSVGELIVVWHPQIRHFEATSDYMQDGVAQLEVAITGPTDTPIRLDAFAPDGTKLGSMKVENDGSDRQTVLFAVPHGKDHPVVTIKAFVPTEQTGTPSGSVEVRNASFEPEIEALNQRLAANPTSGELYYERAQLLVARGLRKAAARDFQSAIDHGMTELLESPQYQQFTSQRRAEGFHEDLKALASFFVPFARKELNIG